MSDGNRFGRQLSLITVDQAISSASNILFLVLAAHLLALGSFGYFNIVYGVYALTQSIGRGLVSDPMLIQPDEAERRPQQMVAASLFSGLALGAIIATCGAFLSLDHSPLGPPLLVLAALMPLLLIQDLGRYVAFAVRKPGFAVVLDTVWLVTAVVASAAVYVLHQRSLAVYVLAWAGSGALAGLLVFHRIRGGARINPGWVRENWTYSSRYIVGYVANQGSALLVTVLCGWILGPAGLGALLAALLLSRPFGTFQIAASASTVIHVARAETEGHSVSDTLRRMGVLVLGVAAVMSAVLLVLPPSLGRVALGGAWASAEPLLIPVCAAMFVTALMTPARAGLLGLKRVALTTRIDVMAAASAVAGSVIGAKVGGASGALWAVVVLNLAAAGLYWAALVAVRTTGRSAGRHRM